MAPVTDACARYREWPDFMATRLIDDEDAQRHAFGECAAPEQREYCAMLATLQHANKSGKSHRPPASSKYQKRKNLEKAGRLLVYSKLDRAIQEHIDDARGAEWANYLKFKAVKVITRKEAVVLISAGT